MSVTVMTILHVAHMVNADQVVKTMLSVTAILASWAPTVTLLLFVAMLHVKTEEYVQSEDLSIGSTVLVHPSMSVMYVRPVFATPSFRLAVKELVSQLIMDTR